MFQSFRPLGLTYRGQTWNNTAVEVAKPAQCHCFILYPAGAKISPPPTGGAGRTLLEAHCEVPQENNVAAMLVARVLHEHKYVYSNQAYIYIVTICTCINPTAWVSVWVLKCQYASFYMYMYSSLVPRPPLSFSLLIVWTKHHIRVERRAQRT